MVTIAPGFQVEIVDSTPRHTRIVKLVTEGDPLYLLEADKSANEVEAPATGILRIEAETGETYEVGTVIGYIE